MPVFFIFETISKKFDLFSKYMSIETLSTWSQIIIGIINGIISQLCKLITEGVPPAYKLKPDILI